MRQGKPFMKTIVLVSHLVKKLAHRLMLVEATKNIIIQLQFRAKSLQAWVLCSIPVENHPTSTKLSISDNEFMPFITL